MRGDCCTFDDMNDYDNDNDNSDEYELWRKRTNKYGNYLINLMVKTSVIISNEVIMANMYICGKEGRTTL